MNLIKNISVNESCLNWYRINPKSITRTFDLKKATILSNTYNMEKEFYEKKWFKKLAKIKNIKILMLKVQTYWYYKNESITKIIKYLIIIMFTTNLKFKDKLLFLKWCIYWFIKLKFNN
jgi:hypothetical protein